MVKEEYEVIPLDPIRALEKRVKKIEESIHEKSIGSEYIELVKTNQQVVADLIRLNTGIVDKLGNLASKIEELIKRIDEFSNKFEIEIETGTGESKRVKELEEENQKLREAQEELLDKISKLEKRINALILSKVPVRRSNISISQQLQR
jgi:predicted RNase H-like nuclease (RuvC/YqgF family)